MTYVLAILFNIFTALLYPSVFFILFITISLVGLLRKKRQFSAWMLVLNLILFYLTANGVIPSLTLKSLQKNLHPVSIQQIKQQPRDDCAGRLGSLKKTRHDNLGSLAMAASSKRSAFISSPAKRVSITAYS